MAFPPPPTPQRAPAQPLLNPDLFPPAVILAGGSARRMGGGDKGLRPLGGLRVIDHLLAALAPQAGALAINANGDAGRFADLGLPVLADSILADPASADSGQNGIGPLAGIATALDWAAGRGAAAVVTVPTDTPFLPPELVARLVQAAGPDCPAIAAEAGPEGLRLHPGIGVWPVALRGRLGAAIAAGHRRLMGFADACGAKPVAFPGGEGHFLNLNTPEALAEAETMLRRRRDGRPRRVLVLDWSAASRPTRAKPSADAIWLAEAGADAAAPPAYFRTRAAAAAALATHVRQALLSGERLLIGADFPFGYPVGFAAALTGRAEALAVWDWLRAEVQDGPDNRNDRFALAARINAALPGIGPFWGRPATLALPDLPSHGTARTDAHGLPERREAETRVPRAQPVWKLFTTGSVGSQALLGIPVLARLRAAFPGQIAVWPFEPVAGAPVVLAEVYPSLLAPEVAQVEARKRVQGRKPIRDAVQVALLAGALARMETAGQLDPILASSLPDAARREEGWILGVGAEDAVRGAVRLSDA